MGKNTKITAIAGIALTVLVGCSSDADNEAVVDLSAAPEQISWVDVHGVQLPVSDAHGPQQHNLAGGVGVQGFEQSPQGACLAAMNHPLRAVAASDQTWGEAARLAFAPGAGRDIYSVNRAQISINGFDAEAIPTMRGCLIAEDYSSEQATVEVFTQYPDQSLAQNTYDMTWSGQDWQIVLPESGQGQVVAIEELPQEMLEVTP